MDSILWLIAGALLAIGALLCALNVSISKYSFLCFLGASALMMIDALIRSHRSLLALSLLLASISALGVRRWFCSERRRTEPLAFGCDAYSRARRAAERSYRSTLN